jgi:hypothetical protein
MPPIDPTLFPLRDGPLIPRELVQPFAVLLQKQYGGTLDAIAKRGGISVFELLMRLPAAEGKTQSEHELAAFEMTLTDAKGELTRVLAAHQAQKEADAEAAMLAMMEAEGAEQPTA